MTLPDLLQRTFEVRGDEALYRFANGLEIRTEVFNKDDPMRILPLGTPQGSLMNHLLNFPEVVRGAHVFEPFAGSGALGFMALTAGAAHVDFLDINPRAADFQRDNAARNQIAPARYEAITGDIAAFNPARPYDVLIANPPFVPTPDGIAGTLTSNGGREGNRFVDIMLRRLDALLAPHGRALIYVFQLVRNGEPLVVDLLRTVQQRPIEITPSQTDPLGLDTFCQAYASLFSSAGAAIERWRAALEQRHGAGLSLCHYIVDIGRRGEQATRCILRDNFAEKFGAGFLVPSDHQLLALDRAYENYVSGG
jgi:hypothetical protein